MEIESSGFKIYQRVLRSELAYQLLKLTSCLSIGLGIFFIALIFLFQVSTQSGTGLFSKAIEQYKKDMIVLRTNTTINPDTMDPFQKPTHMISDSDGYLSSKSDYPSQSLLVFFEHLSNSTEDPMLKSERLATLASYLKEMVQSENLNLDHFEKDLTSKKIEGNLDTTTNQIEIPSLPENELQKKLEEYALLDHFVENPDALKQVQELVQEHHVDLKSLYLFIAHKQRHLYFGNKQLQSRVSLNPRSYFFQYGDLIKVQLVDKSNEKEIVKEAYIFSSDPLVFTIFDNPKSYFLKPVVHTINIDYKEFMKHAKFKNLRDFTSQMVVYDFFSHFKS